MKRSKRHHFLPQFCQRFFVQKGDGTNIWVYDKRGGPPRAQTPAITGFEKNLYTVPGDDGCPSDALETEVFGWLDGIACPILQRILEPGERLTREEAGEVAVFLGYMHARVPRNIDVIQQLGDVMAQEVLGSLPKDPQGARLLWDEYRENSGDHDAPPFEQMERYFKEPGKYFRVSMNPRHALAHSLASAKLFVLRMISMSWSILDAPDDEFFVTSDAPLVSFAPTTDGHVVFGANLVSEELEISFPISPSVCLYLHPGRGHQRWTATGAVVKELNRRTAFMAERFIYSHLRSSRVEALREKFSYTLQQAKIDAQSAAAEYRKAIRKARDAHLASRTK